MLAAAVPMRSSDWPTHSSTRSSSYTSCATGGVTHEHVGVDEREVADEDRHAFTEAPGFSPPRRAVVATDEVPVHGVEAAARVGAVHHVVVHERERVHELERGRDVDDAVVGIAARADERAVTEGGAQALAARVDERAERVDRLRERRVDRAPAHELGVEQRTDAFLDAVATGRSDAGNVASCRPVCVMPRH